MKKITDIMEMLNNDYKTRQATGSSKLGEIIYNLIKLRVESGKMTMEECENILNNLPSEAILSDQGISYEGLDAKINQVNEMINQYMNSKELTNGKSLIKKAA